MAICQELKLPRSDGSMWCISICLCLQNPWNDGHCWQGKDVWGWCWCNPCRNSVMLMILCWGFRLVTCTLCQMLLDCRCINLFSHHRSWIWQFPHEYLGAYNRNEDWGYAGGACWHVLQFEWEPQCISYGFQVVCWYVMVFCMLGLPSCWNW